MVGVANAQTINPPQPNGMPIGWNGTPTVMVGSAAGSGAMASIIGSNGSGTIIVTSGTPTIPSSPLVTITFGGSYAPNSCNITPQNANAVGQAAMIYATQPSDNSWSIGVGGSAVPANIAAYQWSYLCI